MPTPARIHDLLDRHDHERLLRELVSLHTSLPLATRLLLSAEDGLPVTTRALALSRVLDASYRPSRRAIELAQRATEDARCALDAPLWESPEARWVRRAALLGAFTAWNDRLALLRKLGVQETHTTDGTLLPRLTDALASWLHAQLAEETPLEPTAERVTIAWLLSERTPEDIAPAVDRLFGALDDAGAAHHPTLADLFVHASRRRERWSQPAAPVRAA